MLKVNKIVFLICLTIFSTAASNLLAENKAKEAQGMLENIKWLGQASILIKGQKIIYLDPWQIKDAQTFKAQAKVEVKILEPGN